MIVKEEIISLGFFESNFQSNIFFIEEKNLCLNIQNPYNMILAIIEIDVESKPQAIKNEDILFRGVINSKEELENIMSTI
jgi:hypothetical protein